MIVFITRNNMPLLISESSQKCRTDFNRPFNPARMDSRLLPSPSGRRVGDEGNMFPEISLALTRHYVAASPGGRGKNSTVSSLLFFRNDIDPDLRLNIGVQVDIHFMCTQHPERAMRQPHFMLGEVHAGLGHGLGDVDGAD